MNTQPINFQFHEKWLNPKTNRYLKHVYTIDDKPVTGVTTVLSVIAKPALIQWAADMACDHIRDNFPTFDEFFKDSSLLGKLLEAARTAHAKKRDKAADQGTDTHAHIETIVKVAIEKFNGFLPEKSVSNHPGVQSFINWAMANNIKFIESEKRMYSREWWIAGTTDLVFEKDGQRFVGDVKTMKKIWDRTPFLQCAAYMKMLKETDPAEYHGSCIINIPKETNVVETVYSYDFEADMKAFEAALTLYRHYNQ